MTPPQIAGIDHIAILVEDIEAAMPYYTETLGFTVISDDRVAAVQARLVMLEIGGSRLQLVTPIAEGAMAEHLRTHGEGLHHIALKTPQIESAATQLSPDLPVRIVRGGQQRLGGFLPYRPNNVMLELIELEEKQEEPVPHE
jgi:methylmalonyl-CoA epimerase